EEEQRRKDDAADPGRYLRYADDLQEQGIERKERGIALVMRYQDVAVRGHVAVPDAVPGLEYSERGSEQDGVEVSAGCAKPVDDERTPDHERACCRPPENDLSPVCEPRRQHASARVW